jgi:hypothetical protein
MFSRSIVTSLAMFGVCAIGVSQEPSADQDKQVVDSKATHRPAAASISFRKDLGLPLNTLSTLGCRIDAARRAPDPVALAHAAHELAIAEKASGKEAGLTSKTLIKEATELAELRRKVAELKVVSHLAQQIASEQELIASLKKTTALAEEQAKADTQAIQQNQEPTWATRKSSSITLRRRISRST